MAKIEESKITVVDTTDNSQVSYLATTTPYKANVGHYLFGGINYLGIVKMQKKEHRETMLNSLGTLYHKIKAMKETDKLLVRNEKEWCALIKLAFGLTDEEVQNRGPRWDSAEDRAKFRVFINQTEYNPAFTEKQSIRMESKQTEEVKIPFASRTETAVPEEVESYASPSVPVMADITQIQIPQPEAIVPQAPIVEQRVIIPTVPVFEQQQLVLSQEETIMLGKLRTYLMEGKHDNATLKMSLTDKLGKEKAKMLWEIATKKTTEVVF